MGIECLGSYCEQEANLDEFDSSEVGVTSDSVHKIYQRKGHLGCVGKLFEASDSRLWTRGRHLVESFLGTWFGLAGMLVCFLIGEIYGTN